MADEIGKAKATAEGMIAQNKRGEETWQETLARVLRQSPGGKVVASGGKFEEAATPEELQKDYEAYAETPTRLLRSGAQLLTGNLWQVLPTLQKPTAETPTLGDIAQSAGLENPVALTALDLAEQMGGGKLAGKGGNVVRQGNLRFKSEGGLAPQEKIVQKLSAAEDTIAGMRGLSEKLRNKVMGAPSPEEAARAAAVAREALEAAKRQYGKELMAAASEHERKNILDRIETFMRLFRKARGI